MMLNTLLRGVGAGAPPLLAALGWCTCSAAAEPVFALSELALPGRTVASVAADFNGDRRVDLMLASLEGMPPDEARNMHVFLQQDDGSFPAQASYSVAIPVASAVFDVADLTAAPGDELVLLRPHGVSIVSLATGTAETRDIDVPGPSTVGAADDERGFDHFRLVYRDFDTQPWIVVPQIGALTAVTADGTVMASVTIPPRANYYVAKRSGLVSVESDIQLFLDVPRLAAGDVDGDGRADLVASTRHQVHVLLNDPEHGFAPRPSYTLHPRLISPRDHARGSGSVVTTARDIDNDGRLDLMLSHVEGSFSDTVTTTYLYPNRNGRLDIGSAAERRVSQGALGSDLLLDVDGDGILELAQVQIKFSVLEVVEFFLTGKLDARIAVYRHGADGGLETRPWARKKLSTAISFDTGRPKGFMPTGDVDLNADGWLDLVTSRSGSGMTVYLGGADGPFSGPTVRQKFASAGVIRFTDLNADGLPDFVLFDSRAPDSPALIGRNLGTLPGAALR